MANEDIDSGLFNISLGSDTEEDAEGQDASKPPARDRTGQTEEQFQAVRRTYRAKVENGEIWKSLQIPLGGRKVSKHEAQELLHAVEELYFYRRYDEGVALVGRIFDDDGGQGLDKDIRELLRKYERKCLEKLGRDVA